MLTELATMTVGRDTITLYQTDTPMSRNGVAEAHDGYRDRYVFDVKGPRLSGMGAVHASVSWISEGAGYKRKVDSWQADATPRVDVSVDAHTLSANMPDGDAAITLNGITYRHGMYWEGDRLVRSSVNRAHDYGRISEAADTRLTTLFRAVREMFLALPDAERATITRALKDERSRAEAQANAAGKRAYDLMGALAAL